MTRKPQWTPAAVKALAEGEIENAIIALTPGGIEAQEAAGQRSFVNSATLPKECIGCTRADLEALGIQFHGESDGLFVNATLPKGWKKEASDHAMWSYLVDDTGKRRCAMFYKAAFYDRSAHISIEREK